MKTRKIGAAGLEVSAIGYGAMGLSHGYGVVPERKESIKLMRQAYDLGCTFFDTAEGYGMGDNEVMLGEALKPIREDVVIATKFGGNTIQNGKLAHVELTPKQIRLHLEASLKRLQTDHIELYYQHRTSEKVTVEEVANCMGELIKEGKILGWGLSEVNADIIKQAHSVTPLTAIQNEYSIMERMYEKEVIPACEELGIGFVPFSPLAGGFLTGKVTQNTQYKGDDVRGSITRYTRENIVANQPLLDLLHKFADSKNATPAQISLAWMLHTKDFIVPIPGTKKYNRLVENLGAADVELTDSEYGQIEAELAKIEIHGNRTDQDIINGYLNK